MDPFDCYVLGYCIANSRQPMNLILKESSINGMCVKMLTMVEKGKALKGEDPICLYQGYCLLWIYKAGE